jgi:hypothetical protein
MTPSCNGLPADSRLRDGAAPGPAGPDPFDPAALRLSGPTMSGVGVTRALLTLPVRKPYKSWFVHTHPDQDYWLDTAVIELEGERGKEMYLVAPHLWPALAGESTFSPRALVTAVNRQGTAFLWPVRLPGPDGREDEWSRTAFEAATRARDGWVRVVPNWALGAYEVFQATGSLPQPVWPDRPFRDLLHTAFRGRMIDSEGHPILLALRGEA